jgi:hypothetical protein
MPSSSPLPWESELIACGRLVQDTDTSVPTEEAERRFNRYVELVDSFEGTEGLRAARALIRSIQAIHDYGAYQSTLGKLVFAFPPGVAAEAVVAEIPRLVAELPDWAGEVLNMLVQAQGRSAELVEAFNFELSRAPEVERAQIESFIREQEREGWLEHKRGLLAA